MKFCCILLTCLYMVDANFVNTEVDRSIDLQSHLVKVKTKLTARNDGPGLSTYMHVIDPINQNKLAFIAVKSGTDDEENWSVSKKGSDYSITLPKTLKNGEAITLIIEETFANSLLPFPEEIKQNQKQLIKYNGNHFFYSLYLTEAQSTTIDLPSSVVKDYSKYGSTELEGETLKYGGSVEYENVPPKSVSAMILHYENNNPFLAVTQLERVIEVSHWGNIAVEETIDIRHIGAKLKGSFSRFDYQRLPNSGASSVKSFKSILPASASDVYYRDEIGNISTSNLLELEDSVELELRPRFPIFGGWKTHYYIGYNLPSYNYLFNSGDLYALKMRFVDHIFDDQVIDNVILKVILPEGSKHINIDLPYDAKREKDSLQLTYLDTSGRPVITFTKKTLVEGHIQDFTLTYKFNKVLLLQEPMLVVSAFFLLFFTVIILVRLDFSITQDKLSEAKMRIRCVIEKIQSEQARRSACYNSYARAIRNYKASKNQTEFANSRKKVDKAYIEITKSMNGLVVKLKEDGASAECLEKVNQLMQNDHTLHEKISQAVIYAEKLVSKKFSKDQYIEIDGKNQKSIDDLEEKINNLSDNL